VRDRRGGTEGGSRRDAQMQSKLCDIWMWDKNQNVPRGEACVCVSVCVCVAGGEVVVAEESGGGRCMVFGVWWREAPGVTQRTCFCFFVRSTNFRLSLENAGCSSTVPLASACRGARLHVEAKSTRVLSRSRGRLACLCVVAFRLGQFHFIFPLQGSLLFPPSFFLLTN
jgi:hypothetical protein